MCYDSFRACKTVTARRVLCRSVLVSQGVRDGLGNQACGSFSGSFNPEKAKLQHENESRVLIHFQLERFCMHSITFLHSTHISAWPTHTFPSDTPRLWHISAFAALDFVATKWIWLWNRCSQVEKNSKMEYMSLYRSPSFFLVSSTYSLALWQ